MKKHLLLCMLLCLSLLTGCWAEEPEDDEEDFFLSDEIVQEEETTILPSAFCLPYAADQTLDPITCPDGAQQVVASLLYEGLFRLDTALEPQPRLCVRYTYDPDTFTYVFTLRDGVAFSDGSPLTAADAAASLRRAMTSERYQSRLSQVSSVSDGEDAVTVVLTSANTGFPALLDIPIVKAGTENSLVPVGTGPYVFVSDEEGVRLKAAAAWWADEDRPVERIGLSDAGDSDTLLYQFTSHDIQLITSDLTGTSPVSATGHISFQDADTTVLQYVGINISRLESAAVRRALSLGINRGAVVSAFLSGHGTAAQFPVSPAASLYPDQLEEDYSHDAFATAMEEAGCATGEKRAVTLLVNEENSFKVSIAEYLAETLSDYDLQLEVRALPWEEYLAALEAGDFDLYYGEVRLTADWDLSSLLGTDGKLNYGGWSDGKTDALLSSFAASDQREADMEALCLYLQQQCPILPVCFKSTSVLTQTGVVENLTPTAAEPFYGSCVIHLQEN